MKRRNFFCALVFLLACGFVHAQVPAGFIDGLTIDISGSQYFQAGNLVSTDVLKVNLQLRYPQCAPMISQSNSYRTRGLIAMGAGALFTIGGLSTMITGVALDNPYAAQYLYFASAANYAIASGCYLVSIPLKRKSARYLADSVQLYNQILQESGKSPPPAAEQPMDAATQTVAIATAAAEPVAGPVRGAAVEGAPTLITAVPMRTIKVDGDSADWTGIDPAFIDEAGDNRSDYPGSDIIEIQLAKDQKSLYLCFSLFGEGLPAFPSGYMYAQVQLELGGGEYLNFSTFYSDSWQARLEIWSRGTGNSTSLAQGTVIRKGKGFEARFPISALYRRIQEGKEYRSVGKIGISRNYQVTELDSTDYRNLTY